MTIGWHFDNTYSKLSDNFKEIIKPTPVKDPELIILNKKFAKELNLDFSNISKKELAKIIIHKIVSIYKKNLLKININTNPHAATSLLQAAKETITIGAS